jgi:glutaryl-CoA dehydrogenase
MERYTGFDFADINGLLSEEEHLVRDTIRHFVETEVIPDIGTHYERATFPMELIPKLAALGVFGSTIKGYGCAGINNVSYGLIMEELERGDSGLRSFASVQSALVMYPIHTFGSDAQKEYWLPKLAAGEAIGCYGLTEPDFGSNPGGLATTAVKDGNEYVLNGTKLWITNASIADVAVIWAKLDGIIHGFLVEKDRPGFVTREITGKLSLRASITSEITLSDCRIPADNLLPGSKGLKCPIKCLDQARYGIAWGAVGAATACFHEAMEYCSERIQFDKPLTSFQITQHKLVDMATEITLAKLLCVQLGRLKDKGKLRYTLVSMAKRNNVRKALEIARTARGMLGANGISGEYSVMRHMCNLESVDTYEGTFEMHTLAVGRELTGISAFE